MLIVRTRSATAAFGPALPFTVLAVAGGVAALVLLRRASPRIVRVIAATAVAAIVGLGLGAVPVPARRPHPIFTAAVPRPSVVTLTVVFAAAAILVAPSLVLLFAFHQRTYLSDEP